MYKQWEVGLKIHSWIPSVSTHSACIWQTCGLAKVKYAHKCYASLFAVYIKMKQSIKLVRVSLLEQKNHHKANNETCMKLLAAIIRKQ